MFYEILNSLKEAHGQDYFTSRIYDVQNRDRSELYRVREVFARKLTNNLSLLIYMVEYK